MAFLKSRLSREINIAKNKLKIMCGNLTVENNKYFEIINMFEYVRFSINICGIFKKLKS